MRKQPVTPVSRGALRVLALDALMRYQALGLRGDADLLFGSILAGLDSDAE